MPRLLRLGLPVILSLPIACKDDGGSSDDGTSSADTSSSAGTTMMTTTTVGTSSESSGVADSSSGSSSTGDVDLPDPLPPLSGVVLTTDTRRVQSHAIEPEPVNDPRVPAQLDQMIADGYGDEMD